MFYCMLFCTVSHKYFFVLIPQEPEVVVKEFMASKPIMSEIEAQIKYYQVRTVALDCALSIYYLVHITALKCPSTLSLI